MKSFYLFFIIINLLFFKSNAYFLDLSRDIDGIFKYIQIKRDTEITKLHQLNYTEDDITFTLNLSSTDDKTIVVRNYQGSLESLQTNETTIYIYKKTHCSNNQIGKRRKNNPK
ncbi:hypothetical protein ACTFIU_008476 [Dictyostelium citrinum]